MSIIEKYVQALNYRNFDQALTLFSDNAKIIDGLNSKNNDTIQGKEAILKWLNTLEKEATFTFDTENIEVQDSRSSVDFTYIDGATKHGRWTFHINGGLIHELRIAKKG